MNPKTIVPLWKPQTHEPSELFDPNRPHQAANAHLSYRGGPLLQNINVVPIFWGSQWESDPTLGSLRDQLLDFLDFFVAPGGPMLQQLAEYSVPGQTIGPGTVLPEVFTARPKWGTTVKDAEIQSSLKRGILKKIVPASTPNTLYAIYLQPGTTVVDGADRSCQVFCGYHNQTSGSGQNVFYAVMPYPSCAGCTGGLSILQALCSVSSHELCEAITDPVPGTGWYDDANGEIGDICAWQQRTNGMWTWQAEWSNAAGSCI
jgi:hypothetical protein